MAEKLNWPPIIARAAEIVRSYDTGVTLRQLHYRLVSEQAYANTQNNYKRLSELTAVARRAGTFPDLVDRGRAIHRPPSWDSVHAGIAALLHQYRLDRTSGQDVSVYLGVEKAGMVIQLESWFSGYGVPIVALGGYSSQTYVKDIALDVHAQDRPAILLYAGDYDASGEDIDRDLIARTGCWAKVHRIGLTEAQVQQYELPENPGKTTDSRAAGFIERHGRLVQVELDALPPETLRTLYSDALAEYWDTAAYEAVLRAEDDDRGQLATVLQSLAD
jgi:hypothetical protein